MKKRRTLLQYWTTRYLITLIIGLLIIAIFSVAWIRHTTLEHRLDMLKFLTEEIADRMINNEQDQFERKQSLLYRFKEKDRNLEIDGNPSIYIINSEGNILSSNQTRQQPRYPAIPLSILENDREIQKIEWTNKNFERQYLVKTPIKSSGFIFGWVVIIQSEKELAKVNEEYRLLAVMLVSLAVLGWLAIYLLSRKLLMPIQEVAYAAKQVEQGNYKYKLPTNIKEQEVHELVQSFGEMTSRLQQLESLRTELLAGVTHELKTPVTSISGLLQAIKDDIVTGEEAKEFMQISLKEVSRMQKMVEDLLEFNSFAANAVPVKNEKYFIQNLISEIIHQWGIIPEHQNIIVLITTNVPNNIEVLVDPIRFQQIMDNLLNNAKQAMNENSKINISIYENDSQVIAIDVQDEGSGIPIEEQPFIFERFFRGEKKKYRIRGLGLGLSYSKMMVRAMGGDLLLKNSTEKGTTFTIILPKVK